MIDRRESTAPRTSEQVAVAGGATRSALPLAIDDLTMELGDCEYTAMGRDAIVSANLNLYSAAVVSDDPQLATAVPDKTKPGYTQAGKLVEWLSAQIETLDQPLHSVLFDMVVSSLQYGCKLAEIVTLRDNTFTGRTQVVLHALKPKPRAATTLNLDPFQNLVGITANVYDRATRKTTRQQLPPSHFLFYSFRPRDSDPRGTTLVRAAYTPWDLKLRTWPEYYRYLVQFASPSLWAEAPPNAPEEPDPDNPEQTISATTALLTQLIAFQNGSAVAVSNGGSVNALWSQGEGKAFLAAFELFNREITTAMLTATRATMEAEHGSKADSQTATDVLNVFIRQTRLGLERALYRQVLVPLVRRNYGDRVARLTPYVSLGGVTEEDVYTLATAVADLMRAKYLDPSQLPELDARLKLSTRTTDELAARTTATTQPPPEDGNATPNDDTTDTPEPDDAA